MGKGSSASELFGNLTRAIDNLPDYNKFKTSIFDSNSTLGKSLLNEGEILLDKKLFDDFVTKSGLKASDIEAMEGNTALIARLNATDDIVQIKQILDEVRIAKLDELSKMTPNQLRTQIKSFLSPEGYFSDKDGLLETLGSIKTADQIAQYKHVFAEMESVFVGSKMGDVSPIVSARYDTLKAKLDDVLDGTLDIADPKVQQDLFESMDNLVTTDEFIKIYGGVVGISPDALIPWVKSDSVFSGKRSFFKKMSKLSTGIEGLDKAIKKMAMMGVGVIMVFILMKFFLLDFIKDAIIEFVEEVLELGSEVAIKLADAGGETIWEVLKPFFLPLGIFCAVILMVVVFFISKGGNPRNLVG